MFRAKLTGPWEGGGIEGKNTHAFFLDNIGAHTLLIGGRIGVGTPHSIETKSLAAGGLARTGSGAVKIIMPLRGSILQAETCQIPSLAENPRWSRVWQ